MTIGIIGSGTMGAGIAQVAAMAGHDVFVYDVNAGVLEAASRGLKQRFERLVEKGKITNEQSADFQRQLKWISSLEKLKAADLVVEAIVEQLEVKEKVFKEVEAVVSNTCVMASNTSSLSIASLAAACNHPERVIGLHFFNPAPVMKLVEIIPAVQTKSGLAQEMKALMQQWGKVPVLAKDTPAFIVNRIARPFYGEALRIFEEGIANVNTIDWAMKTLGGFRMGPFELMDFIGNDINYKVTTSVFEAFFYDPRYKPSFTQKRMIEAGYLGRKSGRGFYNYAADAEKNQPAIDEQKGKQVVDRIVAMLINEAIDARFWGIATAEDIELALTKGVNYPKGLLQWADDWGAQNVLNQMDTLYNLYREDRYRASPLLRKKAKENTPFLH